MLRTQPHFWFGRGYGPIFRDDLKRYNVLFCSELEKTCVALCPRVTNGPSDPFSVPEEWMKLPQGGWNSGRWTCSPRLSYKEFLKQSAMLPKALLEQCLQSASMAHGGLYFTLETAKDRLWQPRGDWVAGTAHRADVLEGSPMIAFMDVLLAWGLEVWTSHRLHRVRYGRVQVSVWELTDQSPTPQGPAATRPTDPRLEWKFDAEISSMELIGLGWSLCHDDDDDDEDNISGRIPDISS